MKKNKIIFFGSGDFPRETFIGLMERQNDKDSDYEIVGLVTSHDRCEDRGKTLSELADEYSLPYIVVNDCSNAILFDWCYRKSPDMFVVISFKKIPQNLLNLVNGKAFNIHASILPFLRGANPIRWAIRHGFKETGLTAIELGKNIDCGDIITNKIIEIHTDDTYGSLKERLAKLSPQLTYDIIQNYDKYTRVKQSNCGISSHLFIAPKLGSQYFQFKIDENLEKLLCSVLPYNGIKCQIIVSKKVPSNEFLIGHTYEDFETIDCTIWGLHKEEDIENIKYPIDHFGIPLKYQIDEIQISGRKRMKFNDFVNGFKYLKPLKEDKGLKFKTYTVRFALPIL